jgi:hypothetical protein
MKITEEARGRECLIRLFGCQHDQGVVACHYPLTDETGMGMKAPDFMIAFGCNHCHAIADGRVRSVFESREQVEIALMRGVLRTQSALWREGKLVYCSDGGRDFDF